MEILVVVGVELAMVQADGVGVTDRLAAAVGVGDDHSPPCPIMGVAAVSPSRTGIRAGVAVDLTSRHVNKGEIMNRWKEREDAIVNSIMSGINGCSTLQKLVAQAVGDKEKGIPGNAAPLREFLGCSIRATLKVCEDEAAKLRDDRDKFSRENEAKRQALNHLYSNAFVATQAHVQAFTGKALGLIK